MKSVLDRTEFSVVDVETTGFSPKKHDRIVEIAVVRINGKGEIIKSVESLVNPLRDVGPTRIHGITAEMVMDAPTFDKIAGSILNTINNSILVAHNASFDSGFLMSEFAKSGIALGELPCLCTLNLSRMLYPELPIKKLPNLCSYLGIEIEDHHAALPDCKATAQALIEMLKDKRALRLMKNTRQFHSDVRIEGTDLQRFVSRTNKTCRSSESQNALAKVISRLPTIDSSDGAQLAYAEKLDEVLLDRIVTEEESLLLLEIAYDAGVSRDVALAIHKQYLVNTIRIALLDNKVSDKEMADLRKTQKLLSLQGENLEALIASQRQDKTLGQSSMETDRFFGKSVCFTGEMTSSINGEKITRALGQRLAAERGIIVKKNIVMDLDYLVASDAHTLSSKARKARDYGISIVAENAFWSMLGIQIE